MTRKRFFTDPVIVSRVPTQRLFVPLSARAAKDQTFMGTKSGMTVRITKHGAGVYKDGKPIASIRRLDDLFVAEDYRRRGIGANLIVAWLDANRDYKPDWQVERTPEAAATFRRAWKLFLGLEK